MPRTICVWFTTAALLCLSSQRAVADLSFVDTGTTQVTGLAAPPAVTTTDQLEGTTPTTAYTLTTDSKPLSALTDGVSWDSNAGVKIDHSSYPTSAAPLFVFDLAASGKPLNKTVDWSFVFQGLPNVNIKFSRSTSRPTLRPGSAMT